MLNNGNSLREWEDIVPQASIKWSPSIVAWAKQAIFALLVSAGLAGSSAFAEEKPKGVQVADASGNVVLANYENGSLLPEDIQAVMNWKDEIVKGLLASERFKKGRYLKMTNEEKQAKAESMAENYIVWFLEGKDTGETVKSIALSPTIVAYVHQNDSKFPLAWQLQIEAQIATDEAQIATDEAQIAKAKKAIKELDAATGAIN